MTFLKLWKAKGCIDWILFAAKSNIKRFFKLLKRLSLIWIIKFFFRYKCCRYTRLIKASSEISAKIVKNVNIINNLRLTLIYFLLINNTYLMSFPRVLMFSAFSVQTNPYCPWHKSHFLKYPILPAPIVRVKEGAYSACCC